MESTLMLVYILTLVLTTISQVVIVSKWFVAPKRIWVPLLVAQSLIGIKIAFMLVDLACGGI